MNHITTFYYDVATPYIIHMYLLYLAVESHILVKL